MGADGRAAGVGVLGPALARPAIRGARRSWRRGSVASQAGSSWRNHSAANGLTRRSAGAACAAMGRAPGACAHVLLCHLEVAHGDVVRVGHPLRSPLMPLLRCETLWETRRARGSAW